MNYGVFNDILLNRLLPLLDNNSMINFSKTSKLSQLLCYKFELSRIKNFLYEYDQMAQTDTL